jgi:hypothetical protein
MNPITAKQIPFARFLNPNLSLTLNLSGLESKIKMKIMIKREQA